MGKLAPRCRRVYHSCRGPRAVSDLIDSNEEPEEKLSTQMLTGSGPPPWSRAEGKSEVNLPQMPHLQGGMCMGVDYRNHPFAPGLPPGRYCPQMHTAERRKDTAQQGACVPIGDAFSFLGVGADADGLLFAAVDADARAADVKGRAAEGYGRAGRIRSRSWV